jgi:hypothetical protein
LPTTVSLNGKASATISSGVQAPNGTAPGTYTIICTAVSGKYNDSTTVIFTLK